MSRESTNLFFRLSRWAARQGENYLTECFLIVLGELARTEPCSFRRLFRCLVGNDAGLNDDELSRMAITTQFNSKNGRPDVAASCPGWLIFIEVNGRSGLSGSIAGETHSISTLRKDGSSVCQTSSNSTACGRLSFPH